ncbi:MAG: hypothetical protein FJX42_06265 [Alphaproteobacteria bacterium]|nr:hypothetical protein [Alphaproteobacteria bacterium]
MPNAILFQEPPPLAGSALAPLAPNRAPVPISSPPLPVAAGARADLAPPVNDGGIFDPRRVSPREIAAFSLDLYAAGLIRWDDHQALAFQPELHPDYDRTIGALLGQKAAPDKPRDFLLEWEQRLLFELRYNAENTEAVGRARRILKALRRAAGIVTDSSV